MSPTWDKGAPPDDITLGRWGRALALTRGGVLAVLVFGCLGLLLLVRLIERPLWGRRRPLTPFITRFVCRNAFRVMGMGFSTQGALMRHPGAVVANHSSWLDIFALNARKRIYFVSKAEVARWPGIGWLARATGTVFIERDPRLARDQTALFEERLKLGHKLLFFPEGTSSDGLRVLPFKPTLFQAFFSDHLRDFIHVQPVAVIYHAPPGLAPDFYGWWGGMEFGPHLLRVLARWRQGSVELVCLPPVKVADFANRKDLAGHCERAIRAAHRARLAPDATETAAETPGGDA